MGDLSKRRPGIALGAVFLVLALGWTPAVFGEGPTLESRNLDLRVLCQAYPQVVRDVGSNNKNGALVKLPGHRRLPWEDGRGGSFEERLSRPDLRDMLLQVYPLGRIDKTAKKDLDPGRMRPEKFFKAIYGGDPGEITAHCRRVRFGNREVLFNARAGAARSLEKVGREVEALLHRRPGLKDYVFPLSGTYSWRRIGGTKRLSPHSFGIAIDLNPAKGFYWRNGNRRKWEASFPSPPWPIVEAFERNGFIWGGKWYHFDSFHFEYRPELILKSRLLAK